MGHLTPIKAIRIYCVACQGSFKAVKNCSSSDCSLHGYKSGHNFKRKGIGNKAAKIVLNARFSKKDNNPLKEKVFLKGLNLSSEVLKNKAF